jgi:hypothetical protein
MAQLQSTSITGSLIVTGGITGSISVTAPGSSTQVLYNDSNVIAAASGLVYSSGNVGINTTSPTSKLTINGNTHIIGSGTPGSGAGMELQYSSNTSYIGSYDRDSSVYRNLFFYSADTIFENGGTERMRITSAGNVGIGTSGPSARLFISAPVLGTSAGDYSLNSIHYNSNSNAEELEIKSVREASGNDWTYGGKRIQLRIDSTYMGYMQFNGYGNNYGISFGTGGTTSAPGNVTERMRITNGGNVGIGTTNPQGKLSVDGGDFRFNYGNASANYYFYLNHNGAQDGGILWTRDNSTFDWQITNLGGSGDLSFYSYGASTQAVTFQRSSGNVGIGTTSPAQKLHVIGNTAVTGITSTGDRKLSLGILDINSGGTPNQIRINTTIPFASGNADFTVNIKGFRYGAPQMVSLSIGWHYYLGSFYNETAISNGAWKPTISLAQDASGYVVIHLSSPAYWPKLYVESVYSSAYGDTYSSGWTWTDADLSNCTNVEVVPYQPLATDISGNAGSTSAVSGTTNYVSKFASSTTIGNSQIFDDGTNVGIGTASPSAKLTVSNGVAYFTQTASNGSAFRWGLLGTAVSPDTMLCMNQLWNGSGWTILDSGVGTSYINLGSQVSSPNIEFGTGPTNTAATTKMIITNGGNVGIGTTSPSEKLHVDGNLRLGTNPTISWSSNTLNIQTATDAIGVVRINGSTSYSPRFEIWNANNAANVIYFDAGGNSFINSGNVGIGTTSPNAKLDVQGGNTYLASQVLIGGTTNSNTSYMYDANGGSYYQAPPALIRLDSAASGSGIEEAPVALFIHNENGSDNTWTKLSLGSREAAGSGNSVSVAGIAARKTSGTANAWASGDLYLWTKNVGTQVANMVLKPSGNVGIGTPNPDQKLEVNGNIKLSSTAGSTSSPSYIWLGNDYSNGTTRDKLKIYLYNSGTEQYGFSVGSLGDVQYHSNTLHDFYTSNSLSVRINGSGNVGINVTSPSAKLQVCRGLQSDTVTPANAAAYLYGSDVGLIIGQFASGPYGTWLQSIRPDNVTFPLSLQPAGGNVGISTSNPRYQLDLAKVNDASQADYIALGVNNGPSGGGGSSLGSGIIWKANYVTYTKRSAGIVQIAESNYFQSGLAFYTNGTADETTDWSERMRITKDGNVGIGTSSPGSGYKLDVNGKTIVNQFQYTKAINYSSGDLNSLVTAGFYDGSGMSNAPNTGWFYVTVEKYQGDDNWVHQTATSFGSGNTANEVYTRTKVAGTWGSWKQLGDAASISGTTNYIPKFTSGTAIGNSVIYESSSNIGIGTTSPGAKLEVNGSFRATTKSFIIDHPTKENKKLQYGVLEGPEHSVYVRGKLTNTNIIQLPDYWHALVHEDSITVNLTAIGKKQDLWVEEITDTYITVASETGDINCFYAVFAERKDVEKLVTEFDKE